MTTKDGGHKKAHVARLPKCDFCDSPAKYDAVTLMGPWANMCPAHFKMHSLGRLGLGVGQELILIDAEGEEVQN